MAVIRKFLQSTIGGPIVALILISVFVALITPRFLHPQNLSNVTLQVSLVAIVAIGATLVILTGGIDLSPGAIVALVCCTLAHLVRKMGVPLPVGIFLMLLMGIALGFFNGFLSSYGRIPSFIVTLATMNIFRGLAFALTGGITIFSVSPDLEPIFYGRLLGIPLPFYYVVILYGSAAIFLRNTIPGRSIYAIGGNPAAARLSGISVNRIRLLAFVIAGLTASIAGILETAWLDSGSAAYGSELALGGIAAAVIGGASLFGGYANIMSSLVGALTVAVVQNGLNLHAVQLAWQDITLGAVIILAVGVDMWKGHVGESLGRLFSTSATQRRMEEGSDSPTGTAAGL
jgi:ribose transport system permease protein